MLANGIVIPQTKNAEHTLFECDSAAHSSTDRSAIKDESRRLPFDQRADALLQRINHVFELGFEFCHGDLGPF
jgi:hypothetical protein